jgi:hypothetical protein
MGNLWGRGQYRFEQNDAVIHSTAGTAEPFGDVSVVFFSHEADYQYAALLFRFARGRCPRA